METIRLLFRKALFGTSEASCTCENKLKRSGTELRPKEGSKKQNVAAVLGV